MPAGRRPTPDTRARVADEDWALDDLTGRTESGVEYVRLDLAETTSSGGLVFEECVFRDVGFDLAEHTAAAFLNCVFVQCRLPNAVFRECKLVGSSFERCDTTGLRVEGGDWSFVSLTAADLRRASFDGVRMRECDLSGVDAQGATLVRCDTASANWRRAKLDGCDLRGTDLTDLDPWDVWLRKAKITWEQAVVVATLFGLDVSPD
jgi:fluoroquinolone resistance protein